MIEYCELGIIRDIMKRLEIEEDKIECVIEYIINYAEDRDLQDYISYINRGDNNGELQESISRG